MSIQLFIRHVGTAALVSIALAGCESKPITGPTEGMVVGVVTVDGVPTGGIVVRRSGSAAPGDNVPPSTTTDNEGRYSLPLVDRAATVSITPPPGVICPNQQQKLDPNDPAPVANFECGTGAPIGGSATAGYTHNSGTLGVSHDCKLVTTSPRRPGYRVSVTAVGPLGDGPSGVLESGPVTATLDSSGQARVNLRINRLGTYRNVITILDPLRFAPDFTITRDVTVSSAAGTCP